VGAEEYETVWRAAYCLDGSCGAQRQSQNAGNRVIDAHCAIIAGGRDPVTEGGRAGKTFGAGGDGSHNDSPSIKSSMKLCDIGFQEEGPGVKGRRSW
jgi:hypothetical protein